MKRSNTSLLEKKGDRKREKRSKIDKEIDGELYQEIIRNAEIILPNNIKKYYGYVAKPNSHTPSWNAGFHGRIPCRVFKTEEAAISYVKEKNVEHDWRIKNIVYKVGDEYYCELKGGQMMLFAYENMDIIQTYTWYALRDSATNYYALVVIEKVRTRFHSLVCPLINPNNSVDHINRITLDNRPRNLREATLTTQNINKKIHSNNTSGVTGVSFGRGGPNNGQGSYVVGWRDVNKIIQRKRFPVLTHGKKLAFQKAVTYRKEYVETLPHYKMALSNQ